MNDRHNTDYEKLFRKACVENEKLKALLRDVYTSGFKDIPGIKYLEVQIYREDWKAIGGALGGKE